MARELTPIDVTDLPDLLQLAEEVRKTGKGRLLRRDGEDLAVVTPVRPKGSRARNGRASPRGRAFTKEDSLWKLVGIGRSGLQDVSENKHKYLAEAYLHQPRNE